jgi:hypothetical protein
MAETFTARYSTCPTCRQAYYQDEPWKRVCTSCYFERKARTATPAPPAIAAPIEPGMLRRLIQLCHPDKHGGSEAATEATRYLLALRRTAP